ncbi:MAG TPA: patatin-like phospholipase family protein [Pyrinomonadaceae bacterium]|nr:patatin-like phospholipase family protein [Pyrinomonadaceae bacterium]
MTASSYLILSCDGGGIRGLVPALLLQQLDKELDFLKRVDLFAGTSTGGVIATGLAAEVPIDNIVNIYMTKGAEIFRPYVPLMNTQTRKKLTKVHKDALSLPGDLLHVKYNNTGLKNLISSTYPATKKLSELNRKVLVTTLDLYNITQKSWVPTTLTNLSGSTTADVSVLDAALSTSAAPVYFPPHVYEQGGQQRAYADGGIFANNPSTLAAATVISTGTLKEQSLVFENIKLLSLGTGYSLDGIPQQNLLPPLLYGVIAWLSPITLPPTPQFPLLSALMDGVSQSDTFQCSHLLGDNFRRGNVRLTEQVEIDDYHKVEELKEMTDAYMAGPEWAEIKQWIGQTFVKG